jgi:hypothetical protein
MTITVRSNNYKKAFGGLRDSLYSSKSPQDFDFDPADGTASIMTDFDPYNNL